MATSILTQLLNTTAARTERMPGISDAVDHVAEVLALLHDRRPLTTVTAWPECRPLRCSGPRPSLDPMGRGSEVARTKGGGRLGTLGHYG